MNNKVLNNGLCLFYGVGWGITVTYLITLDVITDVMTLKNYKYKLPFKKVFRYGLLGFLWPIVLPCMIYSRMNTRQK